MVTYNVSEWTGSDGLAGLYKVRIAAQTVNLLVERVIGDAPLREGFGAGRAAHMVYLLLQARLGFTRPVGGCCGNRRRFQQEAHGKQFLDVVERVPTDIRRAIQLLRDQTLIMQVLDGRVDGSLGNSQFLLEFGFQ